MGAPKKGIGELDKAGKNVKTANGWVPLKGNEGLVGDEWQKGFVITDDEIKQPKVKLQVEIVATEEIQNLIDNYKGGTIHEDVLRYLNSKYQNQTPESTFMSTSGANITIYGNEGINYVVNIGGAKGIILMTEDDLEELKVK